jgi:hypothetical protein
MNHPTIDIKVIFCEDFWSLVNGISRTVKNPPQHIFGNGEFHAAPCELDVGRFDVHPRCALEHLYNGFLSLHFQYLTASL